MADAMELKRAAEIRERISGLLASNTQGSEQKVD